MNFFTHKTMLAMAGLVLTMAPAVLRADDRWYDDRRVQQERWETHAAAGYVGRDWQVIQQDRARLEQERWELRRAYEVGDFRRVQHEREEIRCIQFRLDRDRNVLGNDGRRYGYEQRELRDAERDRYWDRH